MATYDAFISYSHANDKAVAAALQTAVQRLGKPWYRRRALRIFRDDTSLSATPHLWPAIENALDRSRFLILIASPEAAASQWVAKEVEYWLDHKSADTLLIALTDGDLAWDNAAGDFGWRDDSPLPAVVRGRFASEPKWVDLRSYRGGVRRRDRGFKERNADFAAAIHGLPKEDLLSQEVRQQRRALTLAWSAAASLLVLAGAAGWQWKEAAAQRDRAEAALVQANRNFDAATNVGSGRRRHRPQFDLVRYHIGQGGRAAARRHPQDDPAARQRDAEPETVVVAMAAAQCVELRLRQCPRAGRERGRAGAPDAGAVAAARCRRS